MDSVPMLTGETSLLATQYDTLYAHAQFHICCILCGPRYVHRDVWEKLGLAILQISYGGS